MLTLYHRKYSLDPMNQIQMPWLFVNNCILIQSLENVQDFPCYYNRFNLHENV